MIEEQMLFKYLVAVEWGLFAITSLLLIVLSLLTVKLKKRQFTRLFLPAGLRHDSLDDTKARLQKTAAVLSTVRIKSIVSGIILIISLSGIWFLLYKKYVITPIDAETILLGMTAIVPIPIVIGLIEFCLKMMIKRTDNLLREGD